MGKTNKKRLSLSAKKGCTAANTVLDAHGYRYVRVENSFTAKRPYYSSKLNVVFIPSELYSERSLLAITACARVAGEAVTFVEDNIAYLVRRIAKKLSPVSSLFLAISLIAAFFTERTELAFFAFVLFALANILYLATIPVELAINRRAYMSLAMSKEYTDGELKVIKHRLTSYFLN